MNDDEYEVLLGKVILGEASEDEARRLQGALEDAEMLSELRQLAHTLEKAGAADRAGTASLPKEIEERFDAVRQTCTERSEPNASKIIRPPVTRWRSLVRPLGLAAAMLAVLGIVSLQFFSRPGPERRNAYDLQPRPIRNLTDPGAVLLLSPRGEIHYTQPRLIWRNQPNTRYDVHLLEADSERVLYQAQNVISPLSFDQLDPIGDLSELTPGESYRIRVSLHHDPEHHDEAAFRVAPSADDPVPLAMETGEENLLETLREIARTRPSDALMLLFSLPSERFLQEEVRALRLELEQQLIEARAADP